MAKMKTIGKLIKEARLKRHYSWDRLENETKIRKEFINSIEKESWEKLPDYPVVVGFVKNIASILKINRGRALALLRRDYPPKTLKINPKPDLFEKFTLSPKLAFILGVVMVAIAILGYLGFQYVTFTSPPRLEVDKPQEGQTFNESEIQVSGKTDPEATVKINNQQVLIKEDGSFEAKIEIYGKTEEIVVKAVTRSGKETVLHRKIKVELKN